MVSKARLDLPEPDSPVITVRLSRGMSTEIPLRLCSRAPRTLMWVSIRFRSASGCGLALDQLRSVYVLISARVRAWQRGDCRCGCGRDRVQAAQKERAMPN